MGADKVKWISIMIVPEDGAGIRNWRISTRRYKMIKAGLWGVVFFLCAGFVSFIVLTYLFLQLNQYKIANKELLEAASKIEIIAGRLADYEAKERKLREILGGDLDLPQPVAVEHTTQTSGISEGNSGSGDSELQNLIALEESRLRRLPNIWPVDAWQITKEFKYTGNDRVDHVGIDIISSSNSPVVATADGEVVYAEKTENLGLLIRIDHGNGWVTEYGHNSTLLVKYGDMVKKGQTVAVFGGTDESGTGPHLHYAMYYNKQPKNPLDYVREKPRFAENNN